MKFGMGQSVRRTEDIRFVTGQGQYTDDFSPPGTAHAAILRSPQANAKLLSLDISAAKGAPGVLAVLVQSDLEAMGAGDMPCMVARMFKGLKETPQPLLARDRVRWVGQPVAMVIAETYAQARDAADLIMADYDMLPAVGTLNAARADGAPAVWDEVPGNLCFEWTDGDHAAVDEAFATAAHKVGIEVVQNRVLALPMEPRAALGEFDPSTESYTLTTSGQGVTTMQGTVAGMLLKQKPEKLRVIQPDVGGGFGMKMFTYPEQALVLFAARALGRPVKWTGDRSESFQADAHGRDMQTLAEGAFDAEGRLLALRVTGAGNLGAYLSQYAPFIPTMAGSRIWGGVYRVQKVAARVNGYLSNTAPVDAYRGAGRPEGAYFMERLMEAAARQIGLDPIEIRARNLLAPAELPYKNWKGITFDSGDFVGNLREAAAKAGLAGFEARRAEAAKHGKLLGIGVAYYVEITGTGQNEPAIIRFLDNGQVEVTVGTQSNGQGHETSFAQIVAARLGVPFDSIKIVFGDTAHAINGGGTGGSRSLHMAGGAILSTAEQVIEKGKKAASHVLEAAEGDIEFTVTEADGGRFTIAGTDRGASLGALALAAKRGEVPDVETLDTQGAFSSGSSTFPNGAHVCEVEIDADTGVTRVARYVIVDDFGTVINPMILAGQVHGGVAQGLGQALLEHCVYDAESGQLVTGSFMDYGMPRADDMPNFEFHTNETIPCTTNPLGSKGCGEAGTVGALASVMNAIVNALSVKGVTHLDMPATPEKVWRAMRGG
jgi:aerobic carbon-monoxide dehydrogenase large subunit